MFDIASIYSSGKVYQRLEKILGMREKKEEGDDKWTTRMRSGEGILKGGIRRRGVEDDKEWDVERIVDDEEEGEREEKREWGVWRRGWRKGGRVGNEGELDQEYSECEMEEKWFGRGSWSLSLRLRYCSTSGSDHQFSKFGLISDGWLGFISPSEIESGVLKEKVLETGNTRSCSRRSISDSQGRWQKDDESWCRSG